MIAAAMIPVSETEALRILGWSHHGRYRLREMLPRMRTPSAFLYDRGEVENLRTRLMDAPISHRDFYDQVAPSGGFLSEMQALEMLGWQDTPSNVERLRASVPQRAQAGSTPLYEEWRIRGFVQHLTRAQGDFAHC